jgi:hypothetical protein
VTLGTVDEWTGTENNRLIVGSAHRLRGTLDVSYALVMLYLLTDTGNGGINVCGSRHGHRRRYEAEDTEWTVVRRKIGRAAGLGGVPRRENHRQRVPLRPRTDGNCGLGTVRGRIVAAVSSTGSSVFRNVDVNLGPKGDGVEDGVDTIGKPVRRGVNIANSAFARRRS